MNQSPYKRSEIMFVKDDNGHNFCIHENDLSNFNTWHDLVYQYWNGSDLPDHYTMDEWFEFNGYTGPSFEDNMIGCHPNYYIKTTIFQPENLKKEFYGYIEDLESEDSGKALINGGALNDADCSEEGMWVQVGSWSTRNDHSELRSYENRRVKITIETID